MTMPKAVLFGLALIALAVVFNKESASLLAILSERSKFLRKTKVIHCNNYLSSRQFLWIYRHAEFLGHRIENWLGTDSTQRCQDLPAD